MHIQLERLYGAMTMLKRIESLLVESGLSCKKAYGELRRLHTRFHHECKTANDLSLCWFLDSEPAKNNEDREAETGLIMYIGGFVEIFVIWNAVHAGWELQVMKGEKYPSTRRDDDLFASDLPQAQAGLDFARSIEASQPIAAIDDDRAISIIGAMIKYVQSNRNQASSVKAEG